MKIISFAVAWGIGGIYEIEERDKLEEILRTRKFPFPGEEGQSIYNYILHFNCENKVQWVKLMPEEWVPPTHAQ